MIIDGQLQSGERINESHLAETLGISRGPIREACRTLEQAGLLTSTTNKGAYVRELRLEEAEDLYAIRSVLAGLIGRLVVERATDQDISKLQDYVNKMEAAIQANSPDTYFKLNLEFHDALAQASHNKALYYNYLKIVDQLHLMRRRGLVDAQNISISNKEHIAILSALQNRDAQGAEKAMRDHVNAGLSRLKSRKTKV